MILLKDRLIDKFSDTSLLAFRVFIASGIGLLICSAIFSLTYENDFKDRIYWVIIAVISVSASVNTNVIYSRAKNIVIFSFLGSTIGTLILWSLQEYPDIGFISVAFLCGFALVMFIYTVFLNYATSVFFIHIYLVMFFGLFVVWDEEIFLVRITCVLIGTLCILAVTLLTKSSRSKNLFLKEIYAAYGDFKKIIDYIDESVSNQQIMSLVEKNIRLNDLLPAAKHEFDSKKQYYQYQHLMILMRELLINLKSYRALLIQQKNHSDSFYCDFVNFTRDAIKKNFKKLSIRYDRMIIQI